MFLKSDYPEFYTKSEKSNYKQYKSQILQLTPYFFTKLSNKDQKMGKNDFFQKLEVEKWPQYDGIIFLQVKKQCRTSL